MEISDILLRLFLFLGGITSGYTLAFIRFGKIVRGNSDGEITLRDVGGKPTIVMHSCAPISKIVEKGYAVFSVDEKLLGIEESRDI